jgi:hypothetical protein
MRRLTSLDRRLFRGELAFSFQLFSLNSRYYFHVFFAYVSITLFVFVLSYNKHLVFALCF